MIRLVIALVACAACEREVTSTTPRTPTVVVETPRSTAPPSWSPVALTVVAKDVPVAITARIETMLDEPETKLGPSFLFKYDVTAHKPLPKNAESFTWIKCRVRKHNLHIPEVFGLSEPLVAPSSTLVRSMTSLVETPEACQFDITYRTTPKDDTNYRDPSLEQVIASTCVRAGGLTDGPCPRESFPPPSVPPGFTIGLTSTKYSITEMHVGGFLFDGGVSFVEQPRKDREYSLAFRCEDGSRGNEPLEQVTHAWIEILPAGATLALTGALSGYPRPAQEPGRCELVIGSEARTGKGSSQIHATYCLAKGSGTPGPCAPALQIRAAPPDPSDADEGRYRMNKKPAR